MKRSGEPPRGLPLLSQRVFNTPLLIHEHKAEVIVAALHQRLGVGTIERIDGTTLEARDMLALAGDARRSYDDWKPFHADGSIAVIPVAGTLVHKYGHLDPFSGMTGYDGIARKFRAAIADPEIEAIWLDIDSPGGEVAGCFALAEEIARYTDRPDAKPVWAYVNEQATSAAYALACVCDRIYAPATSVIGSIGCYIMFVDFSRRIDREGMKVEIIRSSERKGRTTGAEPLDDPARAKLQSMVDETRDLFASIVALGRQMPVGDVLDTKAEIYSGPDAYELGLIDGIASEAEAWAMLESQIRQ